MRNKAVTLVVVAVLMFTLAAPSLMAQAMGGAPANAQKPMATKGGGPHPQIAKAIRHLEETKEFLKNDASNDLEGHKHAAIENINEALKHLHEAMKVEHTKP
jgi:hypothetical protein